MILHRVPGIGARCLLFHTRAEVGIDFGGGERMLLTLVAEILLAVLAVFGLYALVRLLLCKAPPELCVALDIPKGASRESVEGLLRAREWLLVPRGTRTVALLDAALANDAFLIELLRQSNFELYFIVTE